MAELLPTREPVATARAAGLIPVTVHARRAEALDVVSFELCAEGREPLPAFEPGAHIDVELNVAGASVLRQYSLANDSSDSGRYVIGVGRDAASRGGSIALHDSIAVGGRLRIGAPRNHFPLVEDAPHSVLVAGGIGITPLLAMARRLARLGRPWTLYYCVRSPERAAFLAELLALPGGRVITVFDGLPGVARLDMAALVREAPAGAHFYCCGPAPLLDAFRAATAPIAEERVHLEFFSAAPAPAAPTAAQGYTVHLKRQGRSVDVGSQENLLDALMAAGVDVDFSCREGLCGTCETRVVCGTPLHGDPVYAARQNPPTDRMLVCVSRSAGGDLTLDL
jgi:ferredoxin-NADP reductase